MLPWGGRAEGHFQATNITMPVTPFCQHTTTIATEASFYRTVILAQYIKITAAAPTGIDGNVYTHLPLIFLSSAI